MICDPPLPTGCAIPHGRPGCHGLRGPATGPVGAAVPINGVGLPPEVTEEVRGGGIVSPTRGDGCDAVPPLAELCGLSRFVRALLGASTSGAFGTSMSAPLPEPWAILLFDTATSHPAIDEPRCHEDRRLRKTRQVAAARRFIGARHDSIESPRSAAMTLSWRAPAVRPASISGRWPTSTRGARLRALRRGSARGEAGARARRGIARPCGFQGTGVRAKLSVSPAPRVAG